MFIGGFSYILDEELWDLYGFEHQTISSLLSHFFSKLSAAKILCFLKAKTL